jgi:hypothetical protein
VTFQVQTVFFSEAKALHDGNVYFVLFNRIQTASRLKWEQRKEVGWRCRCFCTHAFRRSGSRHCSAYCHVDMCVVSRQSKKDGVHHAKPASNIRAELKLLQLLCEGHNRVHQVRGCGLTTLTRQHARVVTTVLTLGSILWVCQNLLRTQSSTGNTFDLVTAVAEYLITLEAHADDAGLVEALQAMNTLIDMMSGPCLENHVAVFAAKAVDACNRILLWTPLEMEVCVCLCVCVSHAQLLSVSCFVLRVAYVRPCVFTGTEPACRGCCAATWHSFQGGHQAPRLWHRG